METIYIAIATNDLYWRYVYVLLSSLFENNKSEEIYIYILQNDLKENSKSGLNQLASKYSQKIEFLYIDKGRIDSELPVQGQWTIETYFRLLIPNMLPLSVERILYLDVDMIVNKPLSQLYNLDFEGKLFCVCKDVSENALFENNHSEIFDNVPNFCYFNAGMMLWNLKEIRKQYHFEDYMRVAKENGYKLRYQDQDLLNFMHYDQVKFVDEAIYNCFSQIAQMRKISYHEVKENVVIIHYGGTKPWEPFTGRYGIEKIWWDYAKAAPFYQELMEDVFMQSFFDNRYYERISNLKEENITMKEDLKKALVLCEKICKKFQ